MGQTLEQASQHINRMAERVGFDGGGLAVVSNHSQVQAFRYYDHRYENRQLFIRYCDVQGEACGQYGLRFDSDDNVEDLHDELVSFYRDGRLVAISLVARM